MTDEAATSGNELSPTDAAILEMIREGRYDAEIASRLFISTADVKARIERMLAQGGLRERNDFMTPPEPEPTTADDAPPPFERQPRTMAVHNAVLAVVGALAIGVGVGWVIRDEQAGTEPAQTARFTLTEEELASLNRWLIEAPSSSGYRPAPTPSITAFGVLFRTENVAYAVNALSPDGQGGKDIVFVNTALIDLSAGNWTIDRLSNNRLTLAASLRDDTLVLRLEPSNAATSIERSDGAIRISTTDGSTPKVNMTLDGAQWSLGLDGRLVVYL